MTPSALAISSGQGQGWAQQLGGSSFDPVAFAEGIAAERQISELNKAKAEADRINRTRKFLTELKPTDVNKWNLDDTEKEMQKFEGVVLDLAQRGIDPETSPEGRRALNEGRARILEKKSKGEFVQKVIDKNLELLSTQGDKYDPEQYEKWIQGLEALPNLDERTEYVMKVPAFKATFDTNAFLADTVKQVPIDVIETAGRIYEKGDPAKAKAILFAGIDNELLTPEGKTKIADTVQQAFDAGHIKEPTTDAFKDYLFTQVEPMLKSSSRVAPDRGGMNITVGGFGGGSEAKGLQATASTSPAFSKYGGVNEVMFTQQGKDISPVALSDYNGNAVFIKPEKTIFKKNKQGKDQWFVVGKVAKRPSDQIIREAGKSGDFEAFMANKGYQKDPDNPAEYVSIKETETVELPVSNQSGSYGEANYKKISAIMGEDFYDFIRRENAGRTTGKTTGGGQVTDVSNIFGGQ